MVTNLPAEVCRQCGERILSTQTLNLLQRIRDGEAPNPSLAYLNVYDFDEINQGAARSPGEIEASSSLIVVGKTDIGVDPLRDVIH